MNSAEPFVKWAGGKRQIINKLLRTTPADFNRYFEPFVGAGALFFELNHEPSILVDCCEDLITTYKVIKNNVEELIKLLREHEENNSEEYFYKMRGLKTRKTRELGIDDQLYNVGGLTDIEKAARFIYLNKTCYNGLYRLNKSGKFNVPYGRYKNPNICSAENMRNVNQVLKKANIYCGDFTTIDKKYNLNSGDFVYFDPPYMPLSNTSDFTSYSPDNFKKKDQKRLSSFFKYLDSLGVKCMLSNSDTEFIKNEYRKFNINKIKARRTINSVAEKRGAISELIITNY